MIEAMKTETITVANHIAGVIQMNAAKFDCEIIEIGLVGWDAVRISVIGTPENLNALFAYVDEVGKVFGGLQRVPGRRG